MNGFNKTNEISGYFENIGGTAMFYSPHDLRKSIIAGQNALHAWLKQINGVNNVCDLNMHEAKGFNALAKEYAQKTP